MKYKISILLASITIAFVFLCVGYSQWETQIVIKGHLTVNRPEIEEKVIKKEVPAKDTDLLSSNEITSGSAIVGEPPDVVSNQEDEENDKSDLFVGTGEDNGMGTQIVPPEVQDSSSQNTDLNNGSLRSEDSDKDSSGSADSDKDAPGSADSDKDDSGSADSTAANDSVNADNN